MLVNPFMLHIELDVNCPFCTKIACLADIALSLEPLKVAGWLMEQYNLWCRGLLLQLIEQPVQGTWRRSSQLTCDQKPSTAHNASHVMCWDSTVLCRSLEHLQYLFSMTTVTTLLQEASICTGASSVSWFLLIWYLAEFFTYHVNLLYDPWNDLKQTSAQT